MTVSNEKFQGKTFTVKKPDTQVFSALRKKGWKLKTAAYNNGSDFISGKKLFPGVGYRAIMVNMFNRRFWVYDSVNSPREPIADETSGHLDNEPWYAEILSCLFEEQK